MDADHRVRAGGNRDLCFSRPGYGYTHSRCGVADVAAAHRGGDVHARFFHQQSDVDGANAGHRFPCG